MHSITCTLNTSTPLQVYSFTSTHLQALLYKHSHYKHSQHKHSITCTLNTSTPLQVVLYKHSFTSTPLQALPLHALYYKHSHYKHSHYKHSFTSTPLQALLYKHSFTSTPITSTPITSTPITSTPITCTLLRVLYYMHSNTCKTVDANKVKHIKRGQQQYPFILALSVESN